MIMREFLCQKGFCTGTTIAEGASPNMQCNEKIF